MPELIRLFRANNGATTVELAAVINQRIIEAKRRFTEQVSVSASNRSFPQPYFYPIARGGCDLAPSFEEGLHGNGPLNANDLALRSSETIGIGGGASATTVATVTVPAVNAAEVAAVLNAGKTVLITTPDSFTGVTYFDYTVRLTYTIETRTGRVYVVVG